MQNNFKRSSRVILIVFLSFHFSLVSPLKLGKSKHLAIKQLYTRKPEGGFPLSDIFRAKQHSNFMARHPGKYYFWGE